MSGTVEFRRQTTIEKIEPLYGIPELHDGHTEVWLEYELGVTLVDGKVSKWTDISHGRELIPYATDGSTATSDNYPSYSSTNGIIFDGVDDVLNVRIESWQDLGNVYIVFSQLSWTQTDVIYAFDGYYNGGYNYAVGEGLMQRGGIQPRFLLYNAIRGFSDYIETLPLNTYGLITSEWSNTSQSLQHNNNTPVTTAWDLPDDWAVGGIVLGGEHGGNSINFQRWCNVAIKAVICRNQVDNATTKAAIKTYLTGKYLQ